MTPPACARARGCEPINANEAADAPGVGVIAVFLLDDHELVRRGLTDLLSDEEGIEVVGEAATAAEALARIPALRPDVAVLDGRLPDGSGIDVCRDLQDLMPDLRCVILTSYDNEEAVLAAVMAGAAGYLLKEIQGNRLVEAIRSVAAGRTLLDPAVTERILARIRGGEPGSSEVSALNERELEVLELITAGLTNRQIGERLFLAEKTIKNYVSSLLAKLGLERRTQAAVYGAQHRRI